MSAVSSADISISRSERTGTVTKNIVGRSRASISRGRSSLPLSGPGVTTSTAPPPIGDAVDATTPYKTGQRPPLLNEGRPPDLRPPFSKKQYVSTPADTTTVPAFARLCIRFPTDANIFRWRFLQARAPLPIRCTHIYSGDAFVQVPRYSWHVVYWKYFRNVCCQQWVGLLW